MWKEDNWETELDTENIMPNTTHLVDQATIVNGDRTKYVKNHNDVHLETVRNSHSDYNYTARLKDLLCNRLAECGWRDEVRLMARNVIKAKGTSIKVEQIVDEVTPPARGNVPDTVKKELLMKIKIILATEHGIDI